MNSIISKIVFLSVIPVFSPAMVGQTWIKNPANGHQYALTPRMTWTEAEAQAVKWGGHLATVRSLAESTWIYNQFSAAAQLNKDGLWIGYTDSAKEGTWLWSSGETSTYTNWDRGEPSNVAGENYAMIWSINGHSPRMWKDSANAPQWSVPGHKFLGVVELTNSVAWVKRAPTTSPPARMYPALAYESVRKRTLLFGGWDGTTSFGDTWEWDGGNWKVLSPTSLPPGRHLHAMAYDAKRNRVVLFGGHSILPPTSKDLGDTWEWDGKTWSNVTPKSPNISPSARVGHAMTYDSTRQCVLMFGGNRPAGFNDIWEWDGKVWTRLPSTTTPPSTRGDLPIAYDPSLKLTHVYGGMGSGGTLSDMWTWDGKAWSPANTSPSPGKRRNHHMAFDTARGRLVLFGGFDGTYNPYAPYSDTWEWSNGSWTEQLLTSSPAARSAGAMVYDSDRERIVLFGGQGTNHVLLNDTWEYSPTHRVFPPAQAHLEGNAAYAGIFNPKGGRSRTQCLLEANGFGSPVSGLITAIGFRRSQGNPSEPFLARETDLKLTFGFAKTTAETMSTTFADNWMGTPSTVLPRTTFNAPAQTAYPGVAPFNIPIPFAQPFAWNGQDLIYEIEVFKNQVIGAGPGLYDGYELDAASIPHPSGYGTVTAFGTSCKGPSGKAPTFVLPAAKNMVPGGTFVNSLSGASANATAGNIIGHSDTYWFGLSLPHAWPGTNCFFYTNMLGTVYTPVDASGRASISYAIPNQSILSGLTAYTQWGVIEAPTAWPPVTLTSAAKLIIGRPSSSYYDSVATLSGSGTGVKVPTLYSVLVTRLTF